MTGNIWWIGPVVLVLLRMLYAEARSTRSSIKASARVFRAATGVLILFAFGIAGFVVLIVKSLSHEESWIIGLGALLTIFLCLSWPSTITMDTAGIERHVWWKPRLRILWDSVVELERGAGGDWTVYGADGKTIAFSRYHADPERFEAEVLKRAKIERSINRGSPTTIGR